MNFHRIAGPANKNLCRPIGKDVIWVRFYRSGKGRLERSLKTNIISEARIRRDLEISKFLGLKSRFQSNVLLVEDKFEEFLDLKKIKSKATHYSMTVQWEKHLKEYFGGMILDEATNTEWLKYVAWKRNQTPDRKFFNDRKYLSMFLHWCHRDGLIEKLHKLEDVDPEIEAGKIFTDEECALLLEYSFGDLNLQIRMALTMGMRHGEIWTLEWGQIDWQKNTIHLPAEKTKIRKARTFAISKHCSDILTARGNKSGSKWVFPQDGNDLKPAGRSGLKWAWKTLRSDTGITGRFHDLRHTFLTRAFKKAVNPALICEYAGLSLEEASKTYLHFTPDDTKIVATLIEVESC